MSEHQRLYTISSGDLGKTLEDANFFEEPWNGLCPNSLARFGVMKDHKGVYYPYFRHGGIPGYKVRKHQADHNFRFYAVGDMENVDLFGQHLCANKKKLVITEGEKDCISVFQMLGTDYDVVSIPTGATVRKDGTGVIDKGVKDKEGFLRKYKEVYIALDQDPPGQAVAEALSQWLGNQCRLVRFSEKDPNEMLLQDKAEEFCRSIQSSEPYRPQKLLTPKDLGKLLLNPVSKGDPYPWPTMNKLFGGMRMGEIVGWGAGVKVGKTNSAMQLTEHIVNNLQEKVGLFYLENSPLSTMHIVSGKVLGDMSIAAGDRVMSQEEVDEVVDGLEGKVWIYGHEGDRSWESIRSVIKWLALSEGVKYFFLDPLTALVPGDAGAANAFLMDMFKELTAMAMQLDIHVNYYSHLNPPRNPPFHEEGGRVSAIQFTGSRAMIRYSSGIVGLSRNVIADDPIMKNKTRVELLLARTIGTQTGVFEVYYNVETGAWLEGPPLLTLPGTGHVV